MRFLYIIKDIQKLRKERKYWRKKLKETEDEKKRKSIYEEYRRRSCKLKHYLKKKKKNKKIKEAKKVEELCKEYDGLAWSQLKSMIPKKKKSANIIEEANDEDGTIRGIEEFLDVWKNAHEKLGNDNPEEGMAFNDKFVIIVGYKYL